MVGEVNGNELDVVVVGYNVLAVMVEVVLYKVGEEAVVVVNTLAVVEAESILVVVDVKVVAVNKLVVEELVVTLE